MIGMIWAQSPEGIIGVDNKIPWHHPGDFKRFKRVTMGSTIVMGRKTFESIGKPLPGRLNIVIAKRPQPIPAVTFVPSIEGAIECAKSVGPNTWFIGGAQVYAAALQYAEVLDVTFVPDRIEVAPGPNVAYMPLFNFDEWELGPLVDHEDAPGLTRRIFRRRAP